MCIQQHRNYEMVQNPDIGIPAKVELYSHQHPLCTFGDNEAPILTQKRQTPCHQSNRHEITIKIQITAQEINFRDGPTRKQRHRDICTI